MARAANRPALPDLTSVAVAFSAALQLADGVRLLRSRGFYSGVLGLTEKPKPPALAVRGGCWFTGAGIELHLGVDKDFRPARKAHPGLFWPELDVLAQRLTEAGHAVIWGDDEIPGMRRFHTHDIHGNRLEFLAPEVP